MDPLSGALWAGAAMLAYILISLRVGDMFPFSRYSMYAKLRGRVEGAVLYVQAGEELVSPTRLEQFVGVDPARVSAQGFPCSQEWVVAETRRWVEGHLAPEAGSASVGPGPGGPDAVAVEIGFRILKMEQFRLTERRVPLTRGWARWRQGRAR